MERKSVIPEISKEVLKSASSAGPPVRRKRKRKDPDLPEFQPPSRGKAHSFKEVIGKEEE